MSSLFPPNETTIVETQDGWSRAPYLTGVIGKSDLTLRPILQAGSIVHIDTEMNDLFAGKDPTPDELARPIYFLKTRDAYFCGWCELDEDLQWLTLIPHPLSSAPSRRWKYHTEVEVVGRAVCVLTQPAAT